MNKFFVGVLAVLIGWAIGTCDLWIVAIFRWIRRRKLNDV